MTRDEALRKAQVALGCHVERDDSEREWCNHPDHSNCPPLWWHVTDVILDVDQEARATALDEAAAAYAYPPSGASKKRPWASTWLHERAQAIREGDR